MMSSLYSNLLEGVWAILINKNAPPISEMPPVFFKYQQSEDSIRVYGFSILPESDWNDFVTTEVCKDTSEGFIVCATMRVDDRPEPYFSMSIFDASMQVRESFIFPLREIGCTDCRYTDFDIRDIWQDFELMRH
jgi:hypothetical protein